MDNFSFQVNGIKEEDLENAIKLIHSIYFNDNKNDFIEGYIIDNNIGLILFYKAPKTHAEKFVSFPSPITSEEVMPLIRAYLRSTQAKKSQIIDEPRDDDSDERSEEFLIYINRDNYIDESGKESYNDCDGVICAIKKRICYYEV